MRRVLLNIIILFSTCILYGSEHTYSFYGFIRNDFFYNSRQNEESLDGIFHFFPKPVISSAGIDDLNAVPQSEMLSIATRLGIDIKGGEFGKARISSKIEIDLAGAGNTYFMMRMRQAYTRFDWQKTSVLVGQTWHPLWGDVFPTVVSFNAGSPFQPFSRNPQLRLTHSPVSWLTLTGAACWQMQTSSNGPKGFSPVYMKNSRTPNLFTGLQVAHKAWTAGGGLDYKRLQPDLGEEISSLSAAAYLQFSKNLLTINGKTVLGNNLSDHVMIGGYARYYNPSDNRYGYTNLTSSSSWLNIIYGKKWQVGIFGGYHQNLGSQLPMLWQDDEGKYTVYGRGFYSEQQELLDRMVRIAPFLMLTVKELTFGVEYNYTRANYGKIQFNGKVENPYPINNHRIVATMFYTF